MNIEINQTDIEKKWQKKWLDSDIYKSDLEDINNKYYCLTMFSYPSGDKLHIGHWYNYGPVDTFARFKRMNGFNVFQPQVLMLLACLLKILLLSMVFIQEKVQIKTSQL